MVAWQWHEYVQYPGTNEMLNSFWCINTTMTVYLSHCYSFRHWWHTSIEWRFLVKYQQCIGFYTCRTRYFIGDCHLKQGCKIVRLTTRPVCVRDGQINKNTKKFLNFSLFLQHHTIARASLLVEFYSPGDIGTLIHVHRFQYSQLQVTSYSDRTLTIVLPVLTLSSGLVPVR